MNKLFFLFAIILANYGFAQNYAYIEKDSIANLYYRLSDNKDLYNTDIYFPYDGGNKGVEISKLSTSKSPFTYQLLLNKPITASTKISLPVFFTENIKSIKITIVDGEGKNYLIDKSVDFQGYQTSIFKELSKNSNITTNLEEASHIYISVILFDTQKPHKLILSDLILADYKRAKVISPLPLFKKMYAINDVDAIKKVNPIFKDAKSNTDWFSLEYCMSPVLIKATKTLEGNNKLLYDVLRACTDEYPFYQEKKQNKENILSKLDAIWMKDSLNSECDLAEKFQQLLRKSFHDGHFKIDLTCKKDKKILGPIRMTHISGNYQVSAVLDSLLEIEIPLGSVITRINNRSVFKLADSLKSLNYTEVYAKSREQLVFNDLAKDILCTEEGNKMIYEYITPAGEMKTASVIYKKKYPLKSNFANPHCEFKELDANTAYFKVNSFDELPVVKFQSIVDKIKDKNLILDMRGNGGGDVVYLDDFLTFFIQDKIITMVVATDRDEKQTDSLCIKNLNPHRVSNSSKIVVLFDAKTACSSEIFINTLKRYNKNVTTIGTDNTSGTLANAFNIVLPTDKYTLTVNAPEVFKYTFGYPLEDVGISPDITVKLNSVYDLKPYNDKVLQTAMQFLGKPNTSQNSKNIPYQNR
jgi:C-terminal processing protease CtpA/Prc